MKRIIDYISNIEICSKVPEKTVKERLAFHNSTFARFNGTIHMPENAYAREYNGVIEIRRFGR